MMITYAEAQDLLRGMARSFGRERVGLDVLYGRVLSGVVTADRDYPPFDRVTMDGYALRFVDWQAGRRRFRVREVVYAGGAAEGMLEAGECYLIMTGAAAPVGADVVVRREDVQVEGEEIVVTLEAARQWMNIARRGEDLRSGDAVIDQACIADASVVGLLATLGVPMPWVEALPRVALLTTGDEVVDAEVGVPGPLQIRNSNRWLLQALLRKWGIEPVMYEHVADDRAILRAAIDRGLEADILICCGGVSAGDADHVPGVMAEAGVKKVFHKIAMRPGKPVWCGEMQSCGLVLALPGNPVSCLVGFILLFEEYLRACWGLATSKPSSMGLAVGRKKKAPLDEFFPVRRDGTPVRLWPVNMNGSGDIRLGMQADALALHPAERGDLDEGAELFYFPMR